MMLLALPGQIARSWAFARHIPPLKLARRVFLSLRRKWHDQLGWPGTPAGTAPAAGPDLPAPVFPPRRGQMSQPLAFTFIGKTVAMPGGVDWRAPGSGAEHQLWRMNLHYMEYLEAADDVGFLALVGDWIAANPPERPGVWQDSWNSYAVSLRVVVWMQQIALRRARLGWSALDPVLASLARQLRFLERNLETDLGGNHLVKNVKALLWASTFFAGPEASRWRKLGLGLLRQALAGQVLADGVHYERSPSYHCQVFADFIECRHVLGAQAPAELDDALARMARAATDLAHPDGLVAQFNDAGLAMAYAPGLCLDALARLPLPRPAPRAVFALESSGYFGLRTARSYFIADCGRIAPDDLPAHGHADVLSFEWSVQGRRIVVDPGVFEYFAGARRDRSRSAGAHNTLCFAGADQADFFGAFRCGRRPDVTLRHYEASEHGLVLEGAHDGFAGLPGAPRHIRRFEASESELIIDDRIEGHPDRAASLSFLFHPGVVATPHAAGVRLTCGTVAIEMSCSLPITIDDAAWWPDMGHEQITRRARVAIACGIAAVVTSFRVADQNAANESGAL